MAPAASKPSQSPPISTTDPLRVRNNQRRSRARRAEYLKELETRVHTYEREGVQASAEVQAAARKVLGENERLREENAQLRALLAEKDDRKDAASSSTLRGEHIVSIPETDSSSATAAATASTAVAACGHAMEDDGLKPSIGTAAEAMDDTSSCEYAAQIITSMRGDVHADDVRAELGCLNKGDCKVHNATLFKAMDRYSG